MAFVINAAVGQPPQSALVSLKPWWVFKNEHAIPDLEHASHLNLFRALVLAEGKRESRFALPWASTCIILTLRKPT
jgi:hypothetical protein